MLLPGITPAEKMADDKPKDLYTCDGCDEQIPIDKARVLCHNCGSYHMCANCYVIKQFDKPHSKSHSTMILRRSGYVVPGPPGFPPRPRPALPPRPRSTVTERQNVRPVSELPVANWGALWTIMKGPIEKGRGKEKEKNVGPVKEEEMNDGSSMAVNLDEILVNGEKRSSLYDSPIAQSPVNQYPPSPPRSLRRGIEIDDSQAPSYPRPASWESLFEADSTPTPTFIGLMSTIFARLDPKHIGYLTPEVYSSFLEIQGYELHANRWKHALSKENEAANQARDVADLELGLYFSEFSIPHTLSFRCHDTNTPDSELPEPERSSEVDRIKHSVNFSANMPLLSRHGFIDICATEYLKDPDAGHEYLGQAVREYGIWKELGGMPRTLFPERTHSAEDGCERRFRDVDASAGPPPNHKAEAKDEEVAKKAAEDIEADLIKETRDEERKRAEEAEIERLNRVKKEVVKIEGFSPKLRSGSESERSSSPVSGNAPVWKSLSTSDEEVKGEKLARTSTREATKVGG